MPQIQDLAAHVATFDEGLATMKHMAHQIYLISRQMPRLAEIFAVDNEAMAGVRDAAEDLEAAIPDELEARIAALRQAGEGLLSKGDADEIEHQRIETALRYAHLAAE